MILPRQEVKIEVDKFDFSHHAYYLVGDDATREKLVSILHDKHSIKSHGNPDLYIKKYETFTIDEARKLKSAAEVLPSITDAKKIFVLQIDNITLEAQNALLKLFEEPGDSVHFFLIISSAHILLQTVKSRMSLLRSSHLQDSGIAQEAKVFLDSSIPKRLEQIKKFVDAIADEKRPRQDAADFLNEIERFVYVSGDGVRPARKLEVISKVREYMNDRAPSFKMLLEYVALNI